MMNKMRTLLLLWAIWGILATAIFKSLGNAVATLNPLPKRGYKG